MANEQQKSLTIGRDPTEEVGSGSVLVVVEGDGTVPLHRHVGPVVAGARQQHVPQEGLDGGLAHQTHEEELLDDGRGDDAQ